MKRINIAELLKDCPSGMELDCTMWDNVTFDHIDISRDCPIFVRIKGDGKEQLTEYGQWNHSDNAKCVIFPKGKTTWEGFHRPYINGDIVYTINGSIAILGNRIGELSVGFYSHCGLFYGGFDFDVVVSPERLATEEEKEKLFDTIKANGYKWNPETKTLKKLRKPLIELKFKVGDRVRHKYNKFRIEGIIKSCEKYGYWTSINDWIDYQNQDDWELAPNKFDINTLIPFESKVLIRDNKLQKWSPAIWGFYDSETINYRYKLIGVIACYCIPYEGNEHLLGKTDDCDEYFKTWE